MGKSKKNYKNGMTEGLASVMTTFTSLITKGEKIVERNPLYPDEDFEEFVARMIVAKKKKIERVLDLY